MSHDIASEVQRLHALLPQGVTLVAVSKFHPIEKLRQAYDAGQRVFGESRVQELLAKISEMPNDVRWHFIGHLQTNKVKSIIGHTDLIESVDSVKLLELIDRLSAEAGVVTRVLLQVHVAAEETKFGFTPDEMLEYFRNGGYRNLHLRPYGHGHQYRRHRTHRQRLRRNRIAAPSYRGHMSRPMRLRPTVYGHER